MRQQEGVSFTQRQLGFSVEQLSRALLLTYRGGFSTTYKRGWVLVGYMEYALHPGARQPMRVSQFVPLGTLKYAMANNL
jgi:hypothetical protein